MRHVRLATPRLTPDDETSFSQTALEKKNRICSKNSIVTATSSRVFIARRDAHMSVARRVTSAALDPLLAAQDFQGIPTLNLARRKSLQCRLDLIRSDRFYDKFLVVKR
jgi:hypothetical protein